MQITLTIPDGRSNLVAAALGKQQGLDNEEPPLSDEVVIKRALVKYVRGLTKNEMRADAIRRADVTMLGEWGELRD